MKQYYFLFLLIFFSLTSCTNSNISKRVAMPKFEKSPLGNVKQILYYSSLAGSAFNYQAWKVIVYNNDSIQVFLDKHKIKSTHTNSIKYGFISLGAFVENFEIAAANLGYQATVNIQFNSDGIKSPAVIIKLKENKSLSNTITLADITQRVTMRTNFKTDEFKYEDIQQFISIDRAHIHYFDRRSRTWQYISEGTQKVANFLNNGKINREVKNQLENSRGWISFMYPEDNIQSWIDCGRLYQRMNLKAKRLKIGYHPMNYLLLNEESAESLKKYLKRGEHTFLLIRIGYVDSTPAPTTSRLPVESFTTFY